MATVGELVFWIVVIVAAIPLTGMVMKNQHCGDEVNITWGMRRDWARREKEWR